MFVACDGTSARLRGSVVLAEMVVTLMRVVRCCDEIDIHASFSPTCTQPYQQPYQGYLVVEKTDRLVHVLCLATVNRQTFGRLLKF